MKTIEVNLIGDLKQTYSPKKGPLPQTITKEAATPEETRETLILIGVGGTAAIAFVIALITIIGCFGFGMYLDGKASEVEDKITLKEAELNKATKYRKELLSNQKELKYQKASKDYVKKLGINLPEVMQELRAKVPDEINLIDIKRSKASLLIKGEVPVLSSEPLKSISMFIINLNTMKPEDSYVRDAFLASTVKKPEKIIFAITANYNDISKAKETKKLAEAKKQKDKKSKKK